MTPACGHYLPLLTRLPTKLPPHPGAETVVPAISIPDLHTYECGQWLSDFCVTEFGTVRYAAVVTGTHTHTEEKLKSRAEDTV